MGTAKTKIDISTKQLLAEKTNTSLRKYGTTYKERKQNFVKADFLGLSYETVYKVSLTKHAINSTTIKKLCDVFGLKLDMEHYQKEGEFRILETKTE